MALAAETLLLCKLSSMRPTICDALTSAQDA
jgi:hypothetical protein